MDHIKDLESSSRNQFLQLQVNSPYLFQYFHHLSFIAAKEYSKE